MLGRRDEPIAGPAECGRYAGRRFAARRARRTRKRRRAVPHGGTRQAALSGIRRRRRNAVLCVGANGRDADANGTKLKSNPTCKAQAETCPFSAGEGYCPIDLQQAYKLPSLTRGKGKTVAIVDAFGYHHAAADLAMFRRTMGLKACGTADKCLRIVNQEGHSSPLPGEPPPSDDWRGEQSLDLDMVSGICPNCKIILVQSQR